MDNPFQILKVRKNASYEEISDAHLKAIRRKTEDEKKILHKTWEMLKDELIREKIKIHCLNFPSDEILFDCLKKTIKPW